MILKPDKTCALVVGIASYGLGKDWDLPGASIGANLFVEWLRREGVDPQRIYRVPGAGADDIRLALDRLKQERQDCECLVLYWAGHGFETEYETRSLFVADAMEIAPKAFKLDEIVLYLKNETPQFTTQLGIIDACAVPRRSTQAVFEHLQMTRQLPRAAGDCRFILAGVSGLDVPYPDEDKPSIFTRRLLELLDTAGMTLDALINALKTDYPIFVRDGRAPYWSGSQAQSDAWALEREIVKIGTSLNLEPARWRAEARRLDPSLDMPDAAFRDIAQKISGWERTLAGKISAALLLRGARAANMDVTDAIRNSPLLAPSYDAAAGIVGGLKAFENPSYLVKTDYLPTNELGVTGVWFFAGEEQREPHRVFQPPAAAPFDDAMQAIAEHMQTQGVSAQSVIQVVTPIAFLLKPQEDMLAIEGIYPLVYRERKRAEGLERYRILRPKFRDGLIAIKSRAARAFKLQWFDTSEEQDWIKVEFPILRTGSCADPENIVEKLLLKLAPFAAVTRVSIQSLAPVNESGLEQAIAGVAQFAGIPVRIYQSRDQAGSILPHLTLIWDDRELPQGYFH